MSPDCRNHTSLKSRNKPGWRKWAGVPLRRLGPTWQASPLRRSIQVVAFGLFAYLFFYVSWPYAQTFTGTLFSDKEWLPVEVFLWMDPLIGLSTSLATRTVNIALVVGSIVLAMSVLVPRGFCGYLCPLGTLIDLFDGLVGRRVRWLQIQRNGWWTHLKYYVLTGVLVAATFGVLLSGFVAAIAVVTRAMAFTLAPLQLGSLRNWGQVRTFGAGDWISIGLFVLILLAGVLRPRFWCRHICPSGAVFSLVSLFRLTERKVEATCIKCGKCAEICPFDAIAEDFRTRPLDCTWCRTCSGVCPVGAIRFTGRFSDHGEVVAVDLPRRRTSRRGFLAASVVGATASLGFRGVISTDAQHANLLRPPGSLPESQFLTLCVRCGQCLQICPGPVLHPAGVDSPLESLWTPVAVMTHAGCHQECNFCTQVCPTGAIQPLSIEEKRKTVMGLAKIDPKTCLPHLGSQDCQLCVDECNAAGYRAINLRRIELPLEGIPDGVFSDDELDEMGHIDAPFVDADACIGCGLCEYRCHASLVQQDELLEHSAVHVVPKT